VSAPSLVAHYSRSPSHRDLHDYPAVESKGEQGTRENGGRQVKGEQGTRENGRQVTTPGALLTVISTVIRRLDPRGNRVPEELERNKMSHLALSLHLMNWQIDKFFLL